MQTLKDDIQKNILETATKHFSKIGFQKTSMRKIAAEVGIGVGNIYNYFTNKDELFCNVVMPVINEIEARLLAHHGDKGTDIMVRNNDTDINDMCDEMCQMIKGKKDLLKILFFKAQGSSLENFSETFTDKATEIVKKWFEENKKKYPEINIDISDFSIHIHTVWQFSLLQELVMHDIDDDEMRKVIKEYIVFETKGWKELIGI